MIFSCFVHNIIDKNHRMLYNICIQNADALLRHIPQGVLRGVADMKKKIAIFTTGWCAEILTQFVKGISAALSSDKADIFLFLCYPTFVDTEAIRQGEMNIFNLPDMHDFDGAVIFGSGLDFKDRVDRIIERCDEAGIPVIMQGARRDGVSYVGSDNYQATKDMCAHLRNAHGVKNIIFFAGSRDSHDSELRLRAVRDHLKEIGCEDDLKEVYYTNWENAAATRRVTELCTSGEDLPDAIICANDGLAMESCITFNKYGYDVPGDILVTGFDHTDDSQVFYPSIASVDQCFVEMGAAAVKLWKELMSGAEKGCSKVIGCKFMPADSCGCSECSNSDGLRRQKGREAFSKRALNTYFNRRLDIIDNTILSCHTFQDFKKDLNALMTLNHTYEGESFHILLEPNFGLSIYDPAIKLNTDRYSRKMEIIYSTEDGKSFSDDTISSRDLIPGYDCEGPNHLYVFLPLHETDQAYGYLIFRDCIDNIETKYLHTYQNRMGLVLDKFRHALTLDLINKRLLDLMRRDPLTNVNNRMAFEDKQKHLQAEINSGSEEGFAIAMFDVNNLKLINDSQGHDAGDVYLLKACQLICSVFKHSPVYRIGGDEFIAVLSGEDFENREFLRKTFNGLLSPYSDAVPLPPEYVSIAFGVAVFEPGTDFSVSDVVKRADDDMYRDKAAKKAKAASR